MRSPAAVARSDWRAPQGTEEDVFRGVNLCKGLKYSKAISFERALFTGGGQRGEPNISGPGTWIERQKPQRKFALVPYYLGFQKVNNYCAHENRRPLVLERVRSNAYKSCGSFLHSCFFFHCSPSILTYGHMLFQG